MGGGQCNTILDQIYTFTSFSQSCLMSKMKYLALYNLEMPLKNGVQVDWKFHYQIFLQNDSQVEKVLGEAC